MNYHQFAIVQDEVDQDGQSTPALLWSDISLGESDWGPLLDQARDLFNQCCELDDGDNGTTVPAEIWQAYAQPEPGAFRRVLIAVARTKQIVLTEIPFLTITLEAEHA